MDFYKGFDRKEGVKLIQLALKEDVGKGDVTSNYFIGKDSVSKALVRVKEEGVIAGMGVFKMVFEEVDESVKVKFSKKEGERVKKGEVIGEVSGNTRSLLKGERLSLNLLQRMSGIATQVRKATEKLGDKSIKVIDTRKTTPNMRVFEKLAVRIGGGMNHRMGLYDMVLVKDNHIEATGGIEKVLEKIKKIKGKSKLKFEVEVKNVNEFMKVVEMGKGYVDRVMLDNFKISDVKKAIKMNKPGFEIEISGGINLKNISRYRGIKGVDFISMGWLTHSVDSLDISLDFVT